MNAAKKRFVVYAAVICFCFSLSPTVLSAKGDKIKHFGFSLLFGAASESCLHYMTEWKDFYKISLGTVCGTVPGFIKEISDSTKEGNRFCGCDLAADFAGALCGAVLSNVVNNLIVIHINTDNQTRHFVLTVSYRF
jgi:VanZ family protein